MKTARSAKVKQQIFYPFSYEEMQRLVDATPHQLELSVHAIAPKVSPNIAVSYFLGLHQAPIGTRTQCLFAYQDHWFGLDIARSDDGLSIIMLDAANVAKNLVGFASLLKQIREHSKATFQFKISYFAMGLTDKVQKNHYDCSIFAWEHLRWAAQKTDFHQELNSLGHLSDVKSRECLDSVVTRARDFLYNSEVKNSEAVLRQTEDAMRTELPNINWIDCEQLKAKPEQWQGFFINSQSPLEFLEITLTKWLQPVHRQKDGKEVTPIHNIKINYCGHVMRSTLDGKEPLIEDGFITQHICDFHNATINELGKVLRNAVAKILSSQVEFLLSHLSLEQINEVPSSGKTALDRANIVDNAEIISLLLDNGAKTGKELGDLAKLEVSVSVLNVAGFSGVPSSTQSGLASCRQQALSSKS
jgi:hypothetical protein